MNKIAIFYLMFNSLLDCSFTFDSEYNPFITSYNNVNFNQCSEIQNIQNEHISSAFLENNSIQENEDNEDYESKLFLNSSNNFDILDEKKTNYKTKINEYYDDNVNNSPKTQKTKTFTYNESNYCPFEKIKEIFTKENFNSINMKFKKCKSTEDIENKLLKRKRKDQDNFDNSDEYVDKIYENKKKRGRKPKENDEYREEHNKMSCDNIVKKIKSKLFKRILHFLNKILNKTKEDTKKLYKIDYSYINQLKKEVDLGFLKMSLKDLFSHEISQKYKSISYDTNKVFIQKIINKEEYVEDYDTVMFAFNMTFRDWLDVFTKKKSLEDLKDEEYYADMQINNVNFEKIQNCFEGINSLLEDILENEGENYFNIFTMYLYNYEKWFLIKSPRKKTNKSME